MIWQIKKDTSRQMTKLSKSIKDLFKTLKKSSPEDIGETVEFPRAKDLFDEARKLKPIGVGDSDEDFEKMDKITAQVNAIRDHEKKHEWRQGEAEYNGKPVKIKQTLVGRTGRLMALIEDEDGAHHYPCAYNLKNVKFY